MKNCLCITRDKESNTHTAVFKLNAVNSAGELRTLADLQNELDSAYCRVVKSLENLGCSDSSRKII